jgi:hypothetical protein
MARHDAPLAQLAEQQTLNPLVSGLSVWLHTRDDLGLHRSRFFRVSIFAPMLDRC